MTVKSLTNTLANFSERPLRTTRLARNATCAMHRLIKYCGLCDGYAGNQRADEATYGLP